MQMYIVPPEELHKDIMCELLRVTEIQKKWKHRKNKTEHVQTSKPRAEIIIQ